MTDPLRFECKENNHSVGRGARTLPDPVEQAAFRSILSRHRRLVTEGLISINVAGELDHYELITDPVPALCDSAPHKTNKKDGFGEQRSPTLR